MSTGALFTLIANSGAQDRLLMATELLNKRLAEIRRMRAKNPAILDETPTLVDIERTHVLFINAHYRPFVAIAFEYQSIQSQEGVVRLGNELTYSIPQFGDFFADMMLHVRLEGLRSTIPGNQVRYCEFLGHRLLKRCRWEVNGNYLDEYDSDVYNMHYQFMVPPNKKAAWRRCAAQEDPTPAYLTMNTGVDEYRELKFIVNGPQTPKAEHPVVDVWMPLLFWFNRDPRLAIPSVSVPYGQRFIRILLARAHEICAGTVVADAFEEPRVTFTELYINNIFVNPEVHDIFIKRVAFSLIRVHRYQHIIVNSNHGAERLDQLKWPTETLYVGMRPRVNEATMEHWHKFHEVVTRSIAFPVAIPNPAPPPNYILAVSPAENYVQRATLRTIRFRTHGVDIVREFPSEFFNSYEPYNYGFLTINSPEDIGCLMATIGLYPGNYQPSGHINLSQTREFYIHYQSDVINETNPGDLLVVAIALNFVLVSDSSMALRYSI